MEPITLLRTGCFGFLNEYKFEIIGRNHIKITKTDISCNSEPSISYYYFSRKNTTMIKQKFNNTFCIIYFVIITFIIAMLFLIFMFPLAYLNFGVVISGFLIIILYIVGVIIFCWYRCRPHIKIKCDNISILLDYHEESDLEKIFCEPY